MFGRKKFAMVMAEFLGTAILTAVVLTVSKSAVGLPYFVAIAAGVTVGFMPLVIGNMSGAHINPAVTIGMWTLRKIKTLDAIVYIAAQFLGAIVALRLYEYLVGQAVHSTASKTFDWRVLVAEAVGTFIFTFGIAAAVFQGYRGLRLAWTVGTALFLGSVVASAASNGLLNPALALGVQSWDRSYWIGPIIGSLVGMNLYALLSGGMSLDRWKGSANASTGTVVTNDTPLNSTRGRSTTKTKSTSRRRTSR